MSIHGLSSYFLNGFSIDPEDPPGLHLIESLDSFIIALVFLVFSFGISRLFIFDTIKSDLLPKWLNIEGLKDLKVLLWETILVAFVVIFISYYLKNTPDTWEALQIPVIILILSISLYFLKKEG
jgi:uncharacterized membrane protein YqhA